MSAHKSQDFSHLVAHAKKSLPNSPGVYYFKDSAGKILYVGKSIRIRDRVLQHIYAAREEVREARLCYSSHTVDHVLTGTELIALLFESAEIKRWLPHYNRAQRRARALWGWRLHQDVSRYYRISVERVTEQTSWVEEKAFVREFLSWRGAEGRRENLMKEEGFCLAPGSGKPCFWHQIDKCRGACAGLESVDDYNRRLKESIQKYAARSFRDQVIMGNGRSAREKSFVVISQGIYQGYGFVPASQAGHPQSLEKAMVREHHNSDIQKILRAYFNEKERHLMEEILEPLRAAEGLPLAASR